MKVETNSITQTPGLSGTEKGTGSTGTNRILEGQSVVEGGTVPAENQSQNNGVPEIPPPSETAPVGSVDFGDGSMFNMEELLMWIANMAAEYIKQQAELLKTRQKSVESGFDASMDAALKNYDKNMTQAIVGIVGASVSLAGSGMAALNLRSAGMEIKNLAQASKVPKTPDAGVVAQTPANSDLTRLKIDQLTGKGQAWNAGAGALSQGVQNFGGTFSADQELDAKQKEALSQLIAKTAESITSNEGSTRQIIEKFVNELMTMLKNFFAASVR
jgi:hypothetical protein